jgi:thymidylate synthase (FAD)
LQVDHNTMVQLRTHRVGLTFDVQSQRYSGVRIERVARGEIPIEEVFYIRPPGVYRDRQGDGYEWTTSQVERMRQLYLNAAQDYADLRAEGVSEEHARYILPTAYFQNVLLTGNARSWLHLFDVRLKADAQDEIRWAMELAEACYRDWVPEIHQAWAAERRGKAILAP